MDIGEFECLEARFNELYSYCASCDNTAVSLGKNMKMCDIFLIDIACYLLYLSSSSRKLLNKLYLFRDSMDCNRLVIEQIIEIIRENLYFTGNNFEKPLVIQIISVNRILQYKKYASLFLDFFRLLGNAVIREQMN